MLVGGFVTAANAFLQPLLLDGFENAQGLTVQGQIVTFSIQPLDTVLLCLDME